MLTGSVDTATPVTKGRLTNKVFKLLTDAEELHQQDCFA